MRIIDRFSSEHAVFLQQLEMLESLLTSGASPEALVAAIRTLSFPLLAHAENEELAFFPVLEEELGAEGGPIAVLTQEHETMQRQLERTTADPTRAELATVLLAFADLLRRHIAKEEGVLFPAAERILSDAALRDLDATIAHAPPLGASASR